MSAFDTIVTQGVFNRWASVLKISLLIKHCNVSADHKKCNTVDGCTVTFQTTQLSHSILFWSHNHNLFHTLIYTVATMKECSFHNSICQCPTDFLLFEAHLSPFRLTLSIALGQDHLGLQEEWWQCGWEETSGKRLVCKVHCLREWKPPNLSVMYQCCEVPTSTKHWHRPGVIWPGAILNVYHLFFFHCMHVTWCEHLSQPLALCQRTFTPPLLYPANFTVLAKQLFFLFFFCHLILPVLWIMSSCFVL